MFEILGTSGNDTLTGTNLEVVYALAGDDLLSAPINASPNDFITQQSLLSGGSGSDIYVSQNNVLTTIIENGSSDFDFLVTQSISLDDPNSVFFEIDNRHLFMFNQFSEEGVFLVDWQLPENRIERFTTQANTEDITSYEDFTDNLTSNINYLGNITSDDLFTITNTPVSSSDFNAEIEAISIRAELLEAFER